MSIGQMNDEGPQCPFCKYVHDCEDWWETDSPWLENDPWTCDGCGKVFRVTAHKDVTWESKP